MHRPAAVKTTMRILERRRVREVSSDRFRAMMSPPLQAPCLTLVVEKFSRGRLRSPGVEDGGLVQPSGNAIGVPGLVRLQCFYFLYVKGENTMQA